MMHQERIIRRMLVAGTLVLSATTASMANAENLFIAGLHPGQRPENAPVITEVFKDQAWYARALTGISWPYPNSLRFLDNQGNWYTPFSRPGMTGYYDLRGWHSR